MSLPQALGEPDPWKARRSSTRVVSSQRQRQLPATTAAVDVQVHDRSPIQTYLELVPLSSTSMPARYPTETA
jgi:hypothetical protein